MHRPTYSPALRVKTDMNMGKILAVAVTGASGSGFAVALLQRLAASPKVKQIHLMVSAQGARCMKEECGIDAPALTESGKVLLADMMDMGSPLSSGSHIHHGMVVIPCSAGTLARVASGVSDSLITRAADVCLKERRPLILCLRESPLNRIHLENMMRAHDAGALIMPLMPAFYHKPNNLSDLFDAFTTRILDQLGIVEKDERRWGQITSDQ